MRGDAPVEPAKPRTIGMLRRRGRPFTHASATFDRKGARVGAIAIGSTGGGNERMLITPGENYRVRPLEHRTGRAVIPVHFKVRLAAGTALMLLGGPAAAGDGLSSSLAVDPPARFAAANRVHRAGPPTIKELGAACDGSTSDQAAFTRAIASEGSVVVPKSSGACVITSSTTLPPTLELVFEMGAHIEVRAGAALTVHGPISAPPTQQIFAGTGTVVTQPHSKVYAAWFGGTDVGVRANRAKAALRNGPGVIALPCGESGYATTIDLSDTTGIHLTSDADQGGIGGDCRLMWTGGKGTGPAIEAAGSRGFQLSNLDVTYNDARFDGVLLSLASAGRANNTNRAHIHHCRFGGRLTGAGSAARLIDLETSLAITIGPKCHFDRAAVAIGTSGGSNNVIRIIDNWFDPNFTTAAISAHGANWRIEDNVFESHARITTALTSAGALDGLIFANNLMVDGGSGGGTHVDLSAHGLIAANFIGNLFTSASGTGLALPAAVGKASGVTIQGNHFAGLVKGADLGRARGVAMSGNSWNQITTAWTGAEPTHVFVAGNDTSAAGAGIEVDNNASIVIGEADQTIGFLDVIIAGENRICSFVLTGADAAIFAFESAAHTCDIRRGRADRVNVFRDGAGKWRLENRRGGPRVLVASFRGR